jgi:hypothetical protein
MTLISQGISAAHNLSKATQWQKQMICQRRRLWLTECGPLLLLFLHPQRSKETQKQTAPLRANTDHRFILIKTLRREF